MPLYLDRRLWLGSGSSSEVTPEINNVQFVETASDLENANSTTLYIITNNINMGTTSIEVPEGGLSLQSIGTALASLYSTEDNYTLFTSPVSGSGSVNLDEINFSISGSGSQVYDLVGATGNEGFTCSNVTYTNCTSRGTLDNFRQGYEDIVSFTGGTPSLILSGTWLGGWVLTNGIVRNLDSSMTSALFEEGTDFVMNSRFRVNINCDLPSTASFCSFTASNFTAPSLVNVEASLFTRDGVFVSGDGSYFPFLDPEDLVCLWRDNNGLRSTVEGGYLDLTTEVATVLTDTVTLVDIAGVWTASELAHFSQSSNNVLQHNGNNPTQFEVSGSLALDANANNVLTIAIMKWSESLQTWAAIKTYAVVVNSIVGSRDVGFLSFSRRITLENGDRVKLQVVNTSGLSAVTLEEDSYIQVRRI